MMKMINTYKCLDIYIIVLIVINIILCLCFELNDFGKGITFGIALTLAGYMLVEITITSINAKRFKKYSTTMIKDLQDKINKLEKGE